MTRHVFQVTGAASPDLPLRVLNLFAQQDLAYDKVSVTRDGDRYSLSVEHDGLCPLKATIIAEKIGAMVLVDGVTLHPSAGGFDQ